MHSYNYGQAGTTFSLPVFGLNRTVLQEQPPSSRKTPQVWEPQYGIPAIQDLIRAIPEHPFELQAVTPGNANRQPEKAQAAYQQWALLARAIYQVREPQDVDQRISFLMQEGQQSPNQITQVLAQSPAVQDLLTRDLSYVQSYSEFCLSQANANQSTWQAELDQYRGAVEIERQRQEQQRIAKELRQQQQQERQHNLKLLGQWQELAISLGKPASYIERIQQVTADYQRGLPLSEKIVEVRQQDLAAYQRQQQKPERNRDWGLSL